MIGCNKLRNWVDCNGDKLKIGDTVFVIRGWGDMDVGVIESVNKPGTSQESVLIKTDTCKIHIGASRQVMKINKEFKWLYSK